MKQRNTPGNLSEPSRHQIKPGSRAHKVLLEMTNPRPPHKPASPEVVKAARAKGILFISRRGKQFTNAQALKLIARLPAS